MRTTPTPRLVDSSHIDGDQYVTVGDSPGCYADCDGSGSLDSFDLPLLPERIRGRLPVTGA